jgi:hypothetical protein
MLTLTDPLAGQEVVIAITVLPADLPRAARPILLTLGVAGKLPVIRTGTYGDLPALLEAAWRMFDPTPTVEVEAESPAQGLLDLF